MYNDDTSLARQVESTLAARADLKSADIKVRVDEGKVTLDGVVDSATEVTEAVDAVRLIPGVKSVDNQLRLRGRGSQSMGEYIDDTVITTAVKARLMGEKDVSSLKIHVSTQDGIVELSGEVDTPEHSRLAEAAARRVDGVKMIKNNLRVEA